MAKTMRYNKVNTLAQLHADIESRVADGALAEVVWGNHDIIDRRLCDLGEARDLPEWFARWRRDH
jgi:hypothetical protein